jgi:hypothetical protein
VAGVISFLRHFKKILRHSQGKMNDILVTLLSGYWYVIPCFKNDITGAEKVIGVFITFCKNMIPHPNSLKQT